MLRAVARGLGWDVDPEDEDPRLAGLRFGVRRCALVGSRKATLAPDGWTLLQQARREVRPRAAAGGGPGPRDLRPAGRVGTPSLSQPARVAPVRLSHPYDSSHPAGSGPSRARDVRRARQGRPPARGLRRTRAPSSDEAELTGRRPVVAILDTGCAPHDGSDAVVDEDVTLDGTPIGYTNPATDPELHGDLDRAPRRADRPARRATARSSPGWCTRAALTPTSSRGGWCPRRARSWRRTGSTRLAQIAELVRRQGRRAGRSAHRRAQPVDGVLPRDAGGRALRPDPSRDPADLGRHGRWWSARPATTPRGRPSRRRSRRGPTARSGADRQRVVPIVSVGALNPNSTPTHCSATPVPGCASYVPGAA